jgi:DNA polymerase-3 subunit epsilon
MSWTEQPIHFVDFEGNQTSGILEFGVATLLRGEIVDARTRLCRPIGTVSAAETAVHGLASGQLQGMNPFADDWEYFTALRETGPLAAHFAGVENALIKSVWPYPRRSPDFARPGHEVIDWGPWIDSARILGQLYPNLETARLESLVEVAGATQTLDELAAKFCPEHRRHYHAALYDALAGALLLTTIARDPQVAALSIMQLLALSTLDPVKRDRFTQTELF